MIVFSPQPGRQSRPDNADPKDRAMRLASHAEMLHRQQARKLALPMPSRNADLIAGWVVDAGVKGVPVGIGQRRLAELGGLGLNLLKGDIPLPAAVIRREVMQANSDWMHGFLGLNGLRIAPHGKTTMAPQLFRQQLDEGAWAITLATSQQLMVGLKFGLPRVILANQPTGRPVIDACFAAMAGGMELIVLADSVAGVEALAAGAARAGLPGQLGILVELGSEGARTGARSVEEGLAVARAAASAPGLELRGFECFEGVLGGTDEVDLLLARVIAVARQAVAEGLMPAGQPVILSAGGTAFFDRVGEMFGRAELPGRDKLVLIRSGCYLTHDDIRYAQDFNRIVNQTSLKLPEGRLAGAMEIWASVQSRPDRNKALLTMGKRDVSFDTGMPVPRRWFRPGAMSAPEPMPRGHMVTGLNDQHAHLGVPGESPLAVGDMVGFGIGHPCTTFDKWQLVWIVDEDYTVLDAVRTFF
jgi:D-serine dehydratase